jgi:hypothetical protein
LAAKRGQTRISGLHFWITLDEFGQVILIDNSANGTAVSYDGWGGDKVRKGFRWIFFPSKAIQIHLPDRFTLDVEFPKHEACQAEYRANWMAFVMKRQAPEVKNSFPNSSPAGSAPIYLPGDFLGEGSFGTVHRVTDVSTAKVYAAKQFRGTGPAREGEIMEAITHVRQPQPKLISYLTGFTAAYCRIYWR